MWLSGKITSSSVCDEVEKTGYNYEGLSCLVELSHCEVRKIFYYYGGNNSINPQVNRYRLSLIVIIQYTMPIFI